MRDDGWRTLDDEALERLLIERWLLRGATLALILVAAIGATYLGLRGVETVTEHVTVGLFLLLALASGVVGFTMRQEDLRIQRELRRRRSPPSARGPSS
ncbi:MAG: hypothetical protein DME12_18095 [Candidatus Rokuibacteriota bacterium]|nr:MAG: hypothetical protein DME12_18095 [Candidatus Rokubacteria bacterium]PYN68426.1 MAG: hypothetical protein DMD93_11120 [Candidatus Rokubacteria bacterium]